MTHNEKIRQHLEATAQEVRSKRRFRFGAVEIATGPDSPYRGVEFTEVVRVSVFDSKTGIEMIFSVNANDVDFYDHNEADENE